MCEDIYSDTYEGQQPLKNLTIKVQTEAIITHRNYSRPKGTAFPHVRTHACAHTYMRTCIHYARVYTHIHTYANHTNTCTYTLVYAHIYPCGTNVYKIQYQRKQKYMLPPTEKMVYALPGGRRLPQYTVHVVCVCTTHISSVKSGRRSTISPGNMPRNTHSSDSEQYSCIVTIAACCHTINPLNLV